jgi:hypothetical protein
MIDLVPNREDYYRQLNNEQDPKIACQSTAATQCIAVVDNVSLLKGPFKQPEDNLRRYCKYDPDCIELCRRGHDLNNPAVEHPSEWADVLSFAINKLLGYRCSRYDGRITPQVLSADLDAGLPIMVSMRFSGISGHYISVVGVDDRGNWIINDPYRDWLHDGPDGYHVIYTPQDWRKHSKGYGLRFSKR